MAPTAVEQRAVQSLATVPRNLTAHRQQHKMHAQRNGRHDHRERACGQAETSGARCGIAMKCSEEHHDQGRLHQNEQLHDGERRVHQRRSKPSRGDKAEHHDHNVHECQGEQGPRGPDASPGLLLSRCSLQSMDRDTLTPSDFKSEESLWSSGLPMYDRCRVDLPQRGQGHVLDVTFCCAMQPGRGDRPPPGWLQPASNR